MYTNKKKVHKLNYCQHRPQLKVNLFYCYFDQTRFAEFFQRTFFRLVFFSPFRAFCLRCLYFIDFYSILLSITSACHFQRFKEGLDFNLLQAVKTILKKRYIKSKKCFVSKFHLWVQCEVSRAIKESVVSPWGNDFSSLLTEFFRTKQRNNKAVHEVTKIKFCIFTFIRARHNHYNRFSWEWWIDLKWTSASKPLIEFNYV